MCGTPYGDVYNPVQYGSGSGSASNSSGAGGGILRFTVDEKMIVDGTIRANGRAGSSNVGGGSGGSIRINTKELEGRGDIQV